MVLTGHRSLYVLFALALVLSCAKVEQPSGVSDIESKLPNSTLLRSISITTDKARYNPGETVVFTADRSQKGLAVRYWHLGELIDEQLLSDETWTWKLPSADFQGYYVEVVGKDSSSEIRTVGTTAVDASSDWTRFPRYGFLSEFGTDIAPSRIESVMENLNSYHINALQYYDWMYDHHRPLAGTVDNPDSDWPSIIGSIQSLETVRGYISKGHEFNIASMWYDLCYGALEWASEDGVNWEWGIYKDSSHKERDYHPLSSPFRSNIYLMNPGDREWQDYFSKQAQNVYKVFDFDGFHIDQLGGRGKRYDYYGKSVDVEKGFGSFIEKMKRDMPERKLAFNAVSLNGQAHIAGAPSDFLYVELWDTDFSAIGNVFLKDRQYDPQKNTVIAGYMNYKQKGTFNKASVLLADAVIFAMGGDHIELGEHMLCNEYFPDSSMKMSSELESSLHDYYDFLTGYENVLRDNVQMTDLSIESNDIEIAPYSPVMGKVNYLTGTAGEALIVHLLNFVDAVHLNWRDDGRTQVEPTEIKSFDISVRTAREVRKVWAASPDINGGAPFELSFKANGMKLKITVPSLKYWTMIVVE